MRRMRCFYRLAAGAANGADETALDGAARAR
jgi:hypothetical protein